MRKHLKKILISLTTISLFMFCYSLTLNPYTNRNEFEQKSFEISPRDEFLSKDDMVNKTKKYHEIREAYLTNKYTIQEISSEILLISITLLIFINIKKIKSPSSKKLLFLWVLFNIFITCFLYIFSLATSASRDVFPPWGDSIAIPIVFITPYIFIFLLIIFTFHILLKYKNYAPSYNLKDVKLKDFKSYFGIVCVLNILLILDQIINSLISPSSLGFTSLLFLISTLYFNMSLLKNKNSIQNS